MSATPNEGDTIEPNVTRRRALQLGATAAAIAATGNAGLAGAASSLDYSSEYVHDPIVDLDLGVAEVDRSRGMGHVEYVDDNGEVTKLEGGALRPRPETDSTTAHNPVTLRADKIDAPDFGKFPRGARFDSDGDGEDDSDVSALDAQHWTKDMSSSAGSGTMETVSGANKADVLHVSTSGQTSGDTALFQFSDFTIPDGELRKHLQLVVDVDTLESGALVEVRAVDSTGATAAARIEPGADGSLDDVVATATGTGIVYQTELGKLADSLDTVERLEVSISEANADLTFTAINLERESSWDFGSYERVNSDDELETASRTEPSGSFSIKSLDTLGSVFSEATLRDVTYAAEIAASRLSSEFVDYEFTKAERYSFEWRHEVVYNFPIPTAYDLSPSNIQLRDEVMHPGERYQSAEHGVTSETVELDDVEDQSLTDVTSQYEGASIGTDLDIRGASAGDNAVLALDYLLRDSERQAMEASGGGGGAAAAAAAGGGGILSSAWAWIGTIAVGVAGYIAYARRVATGR